jgi:hypothetical protein
MDQIDSLGTDNTYEIAKCPRVGERTNRARHGDSKRRNACNTQIGDECSIAIGVFTRRRACNQNIEPSLLYGAGKGENVAANTSSRCFDNV